jgi:hypothetical protein
VSELNTKAVDEIINNVKNQKLKYVMVPCGVDGAYVTLNLEDKDDLKTFNNYLND